MLALSISIFGKKGREPTFLHVFTRKSETAARLRRLTAFILVLNMQKNQPAKGIAFAHGGGHISNKTISTT